MVLIVGITGASVGEAISTAAGVSAGAVVADGTTGETSVKPIEIEGGSMAVAV